MMRRFWVLSLLMILTACAGDKVTYASGKSRQAALERLEQQRRMYNIPRYVKLGMPYEVAGRWYEPGYQKNYDQTGVASWYGPGFHGKNTANGEEYDQYALTAAHPSLPLPSMVRVTNLQNGRSLIVRVNDRGPFSKSRVIDVSERAARILGIYGPGTAKVRVKYLDNETRELWALMEETGEPIEAHDSWMAQQEAREKASSVASVSSQPEKRDSASDAGMAWQGEVPDDMPPVEMAAKEPAPDSLLAKETVPRPLVNEADLPSAYAPEEEAARLDEVSPASGGRVANTSPPTPIVKSGRFLQTGAFSSYENASKMADQLADFGGVIISPAQRGSNTLYRVRVGPLADASTQDMVREQLLQRGHQAVPVTER